MRVDLHLHSHFSPDGRSSLDELILRCAEVGLDRIALTDHNTVEGALALKELGFTLDEIQLIGKMALGRSTTAKERERIGAVVSEKMSGLEHRIRVLTRLRDVLLAESKGGRQEMWDRFSGALALPDRTGTEG